MIVQPDFLDHWKTQMLIASLNDPCAPLYVIRLWSHCQQRRTSIFPGLTSMALKGICRAQSHNSDDFAGAMLEAGFIEQEGDVVTVHQWDETNASLIANWKRGEFGKLGGRPKVTPKVSPKVSPKNLQGIPEANRGANLGKTRVEKSREDKKESLPDPRFAAVTAGYHEAYKAEYGEDYAHTGGKDGTALSGFLKGIKPEITAEQIVKVIAKAMAHRKATEFSTACKRSSTIHGFCHAYNDIRAELEAAKEAKSSPKFLNGHNGHSQPVNKPLPSARDLGRV